LEGNLSFKKCGESLKLMKNVKSPGSNGFTVDFYKFFWKDIGTVFLIYNNSQSNFLHSHANWPEIEEVNPLLYPASDFLIPSFSDSKMAE
jgi:hypothetical protein